MHETGSNEQTTIVDRVCAEGQAAAVRIGTPARKHGVGDADIWHAVRTAIRKIDMDDDLTMLIGPAHDGTLLEIWCARPEWRGSGRHPRHAAASQVLPAHRAKVIT